MHIKALAALCTALLLPLAARAQYYDDDHLDLYARGFADGLDARDINEDLFMREVGIPCVLSQIDPFPLPLLR